MANLVAPGAAARSPARRASSASAGSSSARPTAPSSSATSRAGARAWTPPRSTGLSSNPGVEVVFATLSETSTGVVHDVQAIAEVARGHGAHARGRRGLGPRRGRAAPGRVGHRRRRRRLAEGADVPAGPGLRVGLAARAATPPRRAQPGGRYYFDWARRARASARTRRPPRSPRPSRSSAALDVALELIEEEGLEDVLARHDLLAPAAARRRTGLGLELFGDPDERATVVTAVELPESIDGGKVPKLLRDTHGITANGGQGQLKGRIIRIAHCGYFGAFDVITIARRPRAGAHRAGRRRRARRRRGRRPAGLPRGRRRPVAARQRRERARPASSSRRRSPTPASTSCASASTSTSASTGRRAARRAHRRLRRHAHPLGHASHRRPDRRAPTRLRVIGRAGIGVDNVDVDAATKRGIIVANAPQSNIVAAAEHTMALMLAAGAQRPAGARLADRRPLGALASSAASRSTRRRSASSASAASASSSPQRAKGFGMHVLAFDPFVAAERFRELGVEKAETSDDVYARADFITSTCRDAGDARLARRRGVREDAATACGSSTARAASCSSTTRSRTRWTPARSPGAALDVFPEEPITDHPLFDGYDNVVVTPHLGASTDRGPGPRRRADGRAGRGRAHRRRRHHRGQHPRDRAPRTWRCSGPFMPLAAQLGRLAMALAEGSSIDRDRGRVPGPHRRARHAPAHARRAARRARRATPRRTSTSSTRRPSPRSAGIRLAETKQHDRARLHRPRARDRRQRRASAARSWARRSAAATARTCSRRGDSASTCSSSADISLSSATPTCPGMIGRVGTMLRRARHEHRLGGRRPRSPTSEDRAAGRAGGDGVTTDAPVPREVDRGDRRARRLRRRARRHAVTDGRALGSRANARRGHHQARTARGPPGRGAPGARAAAGRRGAGRRRRRGRELRRHDGARRASTPTRRSRRWWSATRSPARSRRSAPGVEGVAVGDARDGGHALRRLRRAGRRAAPTDVLAAAGPAQLRAGRGDPGQLRDRLGRAARLRHPAAPASAC